MTRVRIEIDDRLTDKEIVIRTPVYDADVKRLSQQLQAADKVQPQLRFFKGDTEYYLDVHDILFFETEDRQINAHTVDDIFEIHYRLYELEDLLPATFMRISKSAILNTTKIFALTHSISNSLVEFQHSQKQVYVSRKYYKPLKARLEERR
ncbi:LytTR family DNA-binding domain-containing protein [Secundilactobacillus paracollinoides]|uniref:DNA-binding protein n=1 Tax=Secundilactobacillus paracollinoides TaxID=240427 RepID=A0A1B2IVF6_9LACO|nr:LytTR family DNA-binding domain-containing protein [Secundilactobacillus paracollinoides]ANZ66044.1 DNA-binding protein [Secundilactobacillus paracollinoides]